MNDHLPDILKVSGANVLAFSVSFASAEAFLRIAAPAAALIYTVLKIVDWFDDRFSKK